MGKQAHSSPGPFATDLKNYLTWIVAQNGREDLSGRWLEKVTEKARARDYWANIIKGERALTTNDIQVLAEAFGTTPFDWVAQARRHASGEGGFALSPRVGGTTDDDYVVGSAPPAPLPRAATTRKPKPPQD